MAITKKQRQSVKDAVESEGFDYVFIHYSDFGEVKDEEFHKLRQDFIDAYRALEEYIG